MILVKEMPTSGQFVAVWEHNGEINTGHYQWYDGKLIWWESRYDEWEECDTEYLLKIQAEYIVQNLAIS